MSLDPIKKGFQAGEPSANPQGRPKGALGLKNSLKVQQRLIGKFHTHPVDKLVEIANFLYMTGKPDNMIEAAAIWTNLLKYFEPSKKPIEEAPGKSTPEDSVANAIETQKLLEELEKHGLNTIKSSKGTGVETGTTSLPSETSSKEDLPGYQG